MSSAAPESATSIIGRGRVTSPPGSAFIITEYEVTASTRRGLTAGVPALPIQLPRPAHTEAADAEWTEEVLPHGGEDARPSAD